MVQSNLAELSRDDLRDNFLEKVSWIFVFFVVRVLLITLS